MSRSRSRSRSPVKRRGSADVEAETCPFLIRIFITKGKHTPMIDFDEGRLPMRDEFQAYGWKHSTPTSLIKLLLPSFPPLYRSPLARFSFRHIYVDASQRGLYRSRDLVSFSIRDLMATYTSTEGKLPENAMDMELDDAPEPKSTSGRKIEEKSLDDYGFITGDLLSVSLYVPEPKVPAGRPIAPGAGNGNGNVPGPGPGVQSFGWGDKAPRGGAGVQEERGQWGRGEALPPQSFRGRGVSGGGPEEPAGGGNWRGGGPGHAGMGIRGAGRRSPELRGGGRRSPELRGGGRRSPDRERERNGHGGADRRSRSRSPNRDGRRESWATRRRD